MQVARRTYKRGSDAAAVENAREDVGAGAGSCQAETAAARGRHAGSARARLTRRAGNVAVLVELTARGDCASVRYLRDAEDEGMGDEPVRFIVLGVDARCTARIERVAGGTGPGHARPADTRGAGPVWPGRLAWSVEAAAGSERVSESDQHDRVNQLGLTNCSHPSAY